MKKWKKKQSKLILDYKFMKIRMDEVELPNGEIKEWPYWDSNDSVMFIGMTDSNQLVMIRQYRYLVQNEVIEFPSGYIDDDENPEDAAKREFEEESGFKCHNMIKLGSFYETYGQLNRKIHLYFSNDLKKREQRLDQGEKGFEDIKVELIDFHKVIQMALDNKIVAMGSTLAILLLNEKIRRKEIVIANN